MKGVINTVIRSLDFFFVLKKTSLLSPCLQCIHVGYDFRNSLWRRLMALKVLLARPRSPAFDSNFSSWQTRISVISGGIFPNLRWAPHSGRIRVALRASGYRARLTSGGCWEGRRWGGWESQGGTRLHYLCRLPFRTLHYHAHPNGMQLEHSTNSGSQIWTNKNAALLHLPESGNSHHRPNRSFSFLSTST